MDPADLVGQLRPIRLPASYADFGWRDGLAAVSLGLFAGLFMLVTVRPLLAPPEDRVAKVRQEVEALSQCGEEERALGLARLLERLAPGGAAELPGLVDSLYSGARTDIAALEAAILAAARRRRR